MCGIFCSISTKGAVEPSADTIQALKARGPDSIQRHQVVVDRTNSSDSTSESRPPVQFTLTFFSTVLALRGDRIQAQPLVHETGSVLCWNGEAWKIGDHPVSGNDSVQVFQQLLSASRDSSEVILKVLTSIAGPFAFVFYHAGTSTLFYGRDRLGRRSLMISMESDGALIISSTSTNSTYVSCAELSTHGVYVLNLKSDIIKPGTLPWPESSQSINKSVVSQGALLPTPSPDAVRALKYHLLKSLRLRVTSIPDYSLALDPSLSSLTNLPLPQYNQAKLAILFSGGLDCTLLALLTHSLLPPDTPIDLLNVAFENPRLAPSSFESCPDRLTGRTSHLELLRTCPGRVWRFVAINVSYAESQDHRPEIIRLMHPHATEMDLSISMALYFASRGRGLQGHGSWNSTPYTTTARVLLSGLGADELFGGYTRHRVAFTRGGFASLVNELEFDWKRLAQRNLGRDDRVLSSWGREVRYPFLDEQLTAWALKCPVWEKCGFRPAKEAGRRKDIKIEGAKQNGQHEVMKTEEAGEEKVEAQPQTPEDLDPAKMLLRLLAWEMGMRGVAAEKKRAIQFGARTAKMGPGAGKAKGTDPVE